MSFYQQKEALTSGSNKTVFTDLNAAICILLLLISQSNINKKEAEAPLSCHKISTRYQSNARLHMGA